MRVQLVAYTVFEPPLDVPWCTDASDADALVEFAGRACYQSWSKPNPATATNATYVRHVVDVGHLSVLEHASATLYVTGVSRSLTHELVRHRHLSFSQLSQRYVDESQAAFVCPPALTDATARAYAEGLHRAALQRYADLVTTLTDGGLTRKEARQAARAVLPNATETKIVVTGNLRAWRHFVGLRATAAADVEIRALAVAVLAVLREVAPASFADVTTSTAPDGTTVAHVS